MTLVNVPVDLSTLPGQTFRHFRLSSSPIFPPHLQPHFRPPLLTDEPNTQTLFRVPATKPFLNLPSSMLRLLGSSQTNANRTKPPLSRGSASWYRSPAMYDLERCAIFYARWTLLLIPHVSLKLGTVTHLIFAIVPRPRSVPQ